MRARLLALLLLLVGTAATAQEIRKLGVTRHGDDYRLTAELVVARPREEVYALLTDYAHWTDLSSSIRESTVLKSFGDRRHHVRTVSRACAFIFCGTVMQVQLVTEKPQREITARTLATQSNLRHGWMQWLLKKEGDGHTRLDVTLEMTPGFWVPPLLGPWMVERTLRDQMDELAAALERRPLAARAPDAADRTGGSAR